MSHLKLPPHNGERWCVTTSSGVHLRPLVLFALRRRLGRSLFAAYHVCATSYSFRSVDEVRRDMVFSVIVHMLGLGNPSKRDMLMWSGYFALVCGVVCMCVQHVVRREDAHACAKNIREERATQRRTNTGQRKEHLSEERVRSADPSTVQFSRHRRLRKAYLSFGVMTEGTLKREGHGSRLLVSVVRWCGSGAQSKPDLNISRSSWRNTVWMWRASCRRRLRCLLQEAVRHSSHFGSRSIVVRNLHEALAVISGVLVLCVSKSQCCFVAANPSGSCVYHCWNEVWVMAGVVGRNFGERAALLIRVPAVSGKGVSWCPQFGEISFLPKSWCKQSVTLSDQATKRTHSWGWWGESSRQRVKAAALQTTTCKQSSTNGQVPATEWESGRLTSFGVEDEKEEPLKQLTMLKSPRVWRNNAANSSNVRRVPTVFPECWEEMDKELRYLYAKIRDNVFQDKLQHIRQIPTARTGAASEPRRMLVSWTKPQTRRASESAGHILTCWWVNRMLWMQNLVICTQKHTVMRAITVTRPVAKRRELWTWSQRMEVQRRLMMWRPGYRRQGLVNGAGNSSCACWIDRHGALRTDSYGDSTENAWGSWALGIHWVSVGSRCRWRVTGSSQSRKNTSCAIMFGVRLTEKDTTIPICKLANLVCPTWTKWIRCLCVCAALNRTLMAMAIRCGTSNTNKGVRTWGGIFRVTHYSPCVLWRYGWDHIERSLEHVGWVEKDLIISSTEDYAARDMCTKRVSYIIRIFLCLGHLFAEQTPPNVVSIAALCTVPSITGFRLLAHRLWNDGSWRHDMWRFDLAWWEWHDRKRYLQSLSYRVCERHVEKAISVLNALHVGVAALFFCGSPAIACRRPIQVVYFVFVARHSACRFFGLNNKSVSSAARSCSRLQCRGPSWRSAFWSSPSRTRGGETAVPLPTGVLRSDLGMISWLVKRTAAYVRCWRSAMVPLLQA